MQALALRQTDTNLGRPASLDPLALLGASRRKVGSRKALASRPNIAHQDISALKAKSFYEANACLRST